MSIDNRHDFLAAVSAADGLTITDHLLAGRNLQLPPGSYTPDWDTGEVDSVTFRGTAKADTLFGGGGEIFTFFLGTGGNDLYGFADYTTAYADYSGSKCGVVVDMSYRGTRSFTDASGAERTVSIMGRAHDGLGGVDYFAEGNDGLGLAGVIGSAHADVMVAGGWWDDFYGGRGNDLLIGMSSHGGAGNDTLIGRASGDWSNLAEGDEGNDLILGTDFIDFRLDGGTGNDRIFAGRGDDTDVRGGPGNDYVDGGAGDDLIDGGTGRDVLVSGAGNDRINPDAEYKQYNPDDPTDGARDVVRVTRDDLGAWRDRVFFGTFEDGLDQIRFADAVKGGRAFAVHHDPIATLPGRVSTVLQIDADGDGLGGDLRDADDYFLTVSGADLSLHDGYLLT